MSPIDCECLRRLEDPDQAELLGAKALGLYRQRVLAVGQTVEQVEADLVRVRAEQDRLIAESGGFLERVEGDALTEQVRLLRKLRTEIRKVRDSLSTRKSLDELRAREALLLGCARPIRLGVRAATPERPEHVAVFERHVLTQLDAIAWLFNIRGSDVAFNPVTIAYAIVTPKTAFLFLDKKKLLPGVRAALSKDAGVRPYGDFERELSALALEREVR